MILIIKMKLFLNIKYIYPYGNIFIDDTISKNEDELFELYNSSDIFMFLVEIKLGEMLSLSLLHVVKFNYFNECGINTLVKNISWVKIT